MRLYAGQMPSRPSRQPPGPSGPQMLANIGLMRRSPPAFLDKCVARFGSVVRFPIPHSDVWLLAEPDHVDHVLRTSHKAFVKNTVQYETLKSVTGDGLLTSDGDVWRQMRRIVAPSFHHKLLVEVAWESHAAGARWAKASIVQEVDREVDVDAAMLDVSLGIVSRTLLGGQVLASSRPLVDAVMDALRIVVSRAQQPP